MHGCAKCGVNAEQAPCMRHRKAFDQYGNHPSEQRCRDDKDEVTMDIEVVAFPFNVLGYCAHGQRSEWRDHQGFGGETSHRTIVRARLSARQVLSLISHAQKTGHKGR